VEIKILGARQGESRDSHFGSILVDGVLALDAGSLTGMLDLGEQARIDNVLLTHHHFDHIKDLAALGFNMMGRRQVQVWCTEEVRAAVEATVLNERVWINFFVRPTPEAPTFIHRPVEPERGFTVDGYRVRSVPVVHSLPTLGYEITSAAGGTVLFTADNGPGSAAAWATATPDLLITEVTAPNAQAAEAAQYGHLAPQLLAEELRTFRTKRGFLPRVCVVHLNPYHEAQIAAEIAALAAELAADVAVAEEGSVITVR